MMSAAPAFPDTAAGRVAETARLFLRTFSRPGRLLVAISGGSDSTALLLAFHSILSEPEFSGFSLFAVTVDHRLRSGSAGEAAAVAALCAGLGIAHQTRAWEGRKPATGLQEQARAARYRLLVDAALDADALAILAGHTADDQRETIAMRSLRGEGPGLSGMAPMVLLDESIWLLRPFLTLPRADLRAALQAWGQSWIEDPSNANRAFERVRLRAGPLSPGQPLMAPSQDERLASAERQGDWLLAHGRIACGSVAFVGADALRGTMDADAALALFRLQAAIGGRVFAPALAGRERVLSWLETGAPGRMTVGGTVFDRRRDGLYLYRESRGLATVTMRPGEGLYDGRYGLAGEPGTPARVGPVPVPQAMIPALEAAGVPPAIAHRAAPAIAAIIDAAETSPSGEPARLRLERRIAAQAAFLPAFDLPVAAALRRLFGLAAVPSPPVRP